MNENHSILNVNVYRIFSGHCVKPFTLLNPQVTSVAELHTLKQTSTMHAIVGE